MAYFLVSGPNLTIESVFGDAVLDKKPSRSFLFILEPIQIRFKCNLPNLRVHQLRLRNYNGHWLMPPYSFSPEIDSDRQNGIPGTFQTFSSATKFHGISAVRFTKKAFNAGMKWPISLFLEQFWPQALCVCVWQRCTRRDLSFPHFFLFSPVEIRFNRTLPSFGVHRSRLRYDNVR